MEILQFGPARPACFYTRNNQSRNPRRHRAAGLILPCRIGRRRGFNRRQVGFGTLYQQPAAHLPLILANTF